MGKTALATNIAYHAAQHISKEEKIISAFSLEMSSEQLSTRILSEQPKLNLILDGEKFQKKR